MLHYRNTVFSVDNVVVSVHGAPDAGQVTSALGSHLSSGLSTGRKSNYSSPFTGGEVRVRASTGGASYVGLAFGAPTGQAGININGSCVIFDLILLGKAYEVLGALLRYKLATRESHIQFHHHSKVHHFKNKNEWTSTFFNPYKSTGFFGAVLKGDASYVTKGVHGLVDELKNIAGGKVESTQIDLVKNRVSFWSILLLSDNHISCKCS